ncbi:hypothetical protein E8E13_003099 [Curvularia kusanoi]|uniref:Uncharacterized protein n=1 Tax=Curvularia kusanoi TaxID=90978 RepID=A0A9P4T413_CURKU|nr:hypothetical protein E8E13_003099 [Curvularia kusanoi]
MTSNTTNAFLPPGITNHGDSKLICFPAKWTDVATFFLGNYVAHAITIVPQPGQSACEALKNMIFAALYPVNGIRTGFQAIFSKANLESTDLRKAAKAGALCRVVALKHYARTRREYSLTTGPSFLRTTIHGRVRDLPEDYGLGFLPPNSLFEDDPDGEGKKMTICSDWSILKVIISMAQLLFAVATLYRTRGDQVNQFGFAAFGLTVIQYALMAFINLVGNLMRAQHPAVYLIQTKTMLLAQQEGAVIEGVVGILRGDFDDGDLHEQETEYSANDFFSGYFCGLNRYFRALSHYFRVQVHSILDIPRAKNISTLLNTLRPKPRNLLKLINVSGLGRYLRIIGWKFLTWIPLAITLSIIAALTGFRTGNSTYTERVLMMLWLGTGSYVGLSDAEEFRYNSLSKAKLYSIIVGYVLVILTFAAPVVADLWVVTNQIMS